MQLHEVSDARAARDFIKVNVQLNHSNPHYIRPLDQDVDNVFSPEKNRSFKHGECTRWVLRHENGELAGRIAAFVNNRYRNKGDEMAVGGIGFFDCIDNQEAADMLFDVARHWLRSRNMEAMDGPINFGERDRWWGLVVEGFQEPLYCMNFNPPYYRNLFENYGFKPFFNQVCFGIHLKDPIDQKLHDRHTAIARDPAYRAVPINKKNLERFAEDFTKVYNAAWATHGGIKQIRKEQVLQNFRVMRPVMDERLIWFAYHHDEPIAMFVNLPDLNQWIRFFNGRFGLLEKMRLLLLKQTRPCSKVIGLVFGVVPAYQGKGVDSYLIVESSKVIQSPSAPFRDYEMQWIGDFNPRMINTVKHLGNTFPSRVLTTYRYLFDPTREFRPHPVLH